MAELVPRAATSALVLRWVAQAGCGARCCCPPGGTRGLRVELVGSVCLSVPPCLPSSMRAAKAQPGLRFTTLQGFGYLCPEQGKKTKALFLDSPRSSKHPFPVILPTGPPGPPEAVTIDEITDTTAQLSWRPGADNHSPITMYVVQARTPFSVGWQAVSTGRSIAWPPKSSADGKRIHRHPRAGRVEQLCTLK